MRLRHRSPIAQILTHRSNGCYHILPVLESKKPGRLRPQAVQHIGEFVARIDLAQFRVGMTGAEGSRRFDRYHRIVHAVDHQRRLIKIRLILIVRRILDKTVAERPIFLIRVVEKLERSVVFPTIQLIAIASAPAAGELKRRGKQHQALDIRMPRSVQRREITAQARSHHHHRFAMDGAIDHVQHSRDGHVLEIALVELRDFKRDARVFKSRAKKLGFARLRTRRKAVQINHARHLASNFNSLDALNLWKSV